jgi:RNA polymerase sigma-70 factor (ECF subfamily)
MTQDGLDDILAGCRANDHRSFEILFKRYYRVLLGIAMRYCRSREEAEDVLQDAFIKIFQNINSYNGSGSFEGWMKRTVQFTAINNYRSNLKANLRVEISETEETVSDKSIESFFYEIDPPEIIGLLQQLPEGYRMAVNLYFIDGYSHKEIAEMMDISVGTSKSQLFKAKNYLKHLLNCGKKLMNE